MKNSQRLNNQLQSNRLFQQGTTIDFIAITLLWSLAIILVNPSGDFPLNDDWSYGIAVKQLIEEGNYHPTGWTSMSLITQVLWGALFCIPFGFSFEALRLSTLVLSLLGIFSIYLLIRHLNQSRWLAIFVALTVAFNPIYFALSHTFMTDVPFTAFTAMSLLFFMRSLRSESNVDLLLGSCLATIAILCRQNGLFIPIAFGMTLLVKYGFKLRYLYRAIFPTVLGLVALLGFQYWLEINGKTPALYGGQIHQLWNIINNPQLLPLLFAKNSFVALMYLGLFLLPILVLLLSSKAEIKQSVWIKKAIIPLYILLAIIVIFKGFLMPMARNIVDKRGIGPLTLHDTHILHLPHVPTLPKEFWIIVTMLSVLGCALILIYMFSRTIFIVSGIKQLRRDNDRIATFFFLSGAFIYFLPLSFLGFVDRYLTPLMVLISLALVSFRNKISFSKSKVVMASAICLMGSLTFFSVTTTHDYLSWNRARWMALQSLTENENIPASHIDGGFEFNGLYLYSHNYQRDKSKSRWWVDDDTYMIAFGEIQGYETIRHYEFTHWMPPGKGKIVILKRQIKSKRETKENHAELMKG